MPKTGIDAATKAAMDAAASSQPAGPEQLPLIPEAAPVERGRGRPHGAVSKRTRDFLDYLEARPDLELPGVWLAKRYSATVEQILAELGMPLTAENRAWADERRQDAAKALAPYVHERRPQAVTVEDSHIIALTVQAIDAAGEPVDADLSTISLGQLLIDHDETEEVGP